MIELAEMAKFMDDDIVAKRRGQERDTIIEIQIARPDTAARATAPARPLVANADTTDFEFVNFIEMFNSLLRQIARRVFVLQIFSPSDLFSHFFNISLILKAH